MIQLALSPKDTITAHKGKIMSIKTTDALLDPEDYPEEEYSLSQLILAGIDAPAVIMTTTYTLTEIREAIERVANLIDELAEACSPAIELITELAEAVVEIVQQLEDSTAKTPTAAFMHNFEQRHLPPQRRIPYTYKCLDKRRLSLDYGKTRTIR